MNAQKLVLSDEVAALRDLVDPVERVKNATDLLSRFQDAVTEVSSIRREAIAELLKQGRSQTEVARLVGLTRGRIGQIAVSGPPPERAFLGTGMITVAIALKQEAETGRYAVAREDFEAALRLKELAASLQLETVFEEIPPPGMLDLNRDNLLVICGPRLSPLIKQVLDADPVLRFVAAERGWSLRDRHTGNEHRSLMDLDPPQSGDVGYLGRLPRLDGKGTFLYIAGIHAMGSSGVMHFLEHELTAIYKEVRTRRFSAIIGCDFDPDTGHVTASRRLTPFYRHD